MLNSNISSTCPRNMVNFSPLTAKICFLVWGTPTNFNPFRVLASLLQRRPSTEVSKTLQDVWPSTGLIHYVHILGPNGISPDAKFTLRPSLAFSYIASVKAKFHCAIWFEADSIMRFGFCCTALEQQLSAKLCGVVQGMELWNFAEGAIYIRLGGHHVGHRPTF